MQKISTVIITLNSDKTLERTLQSLSWCDEIIVVDSESSDQTKKICEKYKVNFSTRKFNGYGEQKNYASTLAKNDWVLSIDDDEVLTRDLILEIQNELKAPKYTCYRLKMLNIFMNTEMKLWPNNSSDSQIRLFNKKFHNFNLNKVHEAVECTESGLMQNSYQHFSYRSIEDYWTKFNRYTSLGAKNAFEKNKSSNIYISFFKIPLVFMKVYFLQGAFRLGQAGLVWSVFSSIYPFVKYVKLKEMQSGSLS